MKIFGAICSLRHVLVAEEDRGDMEEIYLAIDGIGLLIRYKNESQLIPENIKRHSIETSTVLRYVPAASREEAIRTFMNLDGFDVGGEKAKSKAIWFNPSTIMEISCSRYLHLNKSGSPICGKSRVGPDEHDDLYGEIGFCVLSISAGTREDYPDICPVLNNQSLNDWLRKGLGERHGQRVCSFDIIEKELACS